MTICPHCGQPRFIGDWPICDDGSGKHGHSAPHGRVGPRAAHHSERTVLYRHPSTGKILYPGRNDEPMPAKFAAEGYQTWEPTFDEQRSLEKTGVVSHALNYDSNGHSLDSLHTT